MQKYFLDTAIENNEEISRDLVKFLGFVKTDLPESEQDFEDSFIRHVQEIIRRIKKSRKIEEQFMLLEEMLKDERTEGKAEGVSEGLAAGKIKEKAEAITELLEDLGAVSETVRDKILNEKDPQQLKNGITFHPELTLWMRF